MNELPPNQKTTHFRKTDISSSAEMADAPGATESFRYREIEELNRGGCGLVVKAYDQLLQREILLKKILPEHRDNAALKSRFLHEALITAHLEHPGIVPVHDAGTDPATGASYFAMRWLHGNTMAQAIAQRDPYEVHNIQSRSTRELLMRFQQITRTVAYAHQHGVVHRDLKPENVQLGMFGETIVLDWGVAKVLPYSALRAQSKENGKVSSAGGSGDFDQALQGSIGEQTSQGMILGTASYMSPEQARGDSHLVDERSDIFSLGTMLYEILAGRSPFRCPTAQETMQHILRAEYAPLRKIAPHVPRPLEAICQKALSLKPQQRYANASELDEDLTAYFASERVSAFREPWWYTVDRIATKHRTIAWSAFLSMSLVALILILSFASVHHAKNCERIARQFAESEHREKAVALQREQVAHHEAVTQLEAARQSVDHWILDLDSDLSRYPGLEELRKHLLDKAHSHYETLASQETGSPLMNLEVARVKIRLAEIQHALRNNDRSIELFQSALKHLESSFSADNSDFFPITQIQMAKARIGLANILKDRIGQENAVMGLLSDATTSMKSIGDHSSVFFEAQRTLTNALQTRAACCYAAGDTDVADELLTEAIDIEKSIQQKFPKNVNFRTLVAILENLARNRFELANYAEARSTYQQLIDTLDGMLSNGRSRPDWLEARANAKVYLATCNSHLIQPNEAILSLEAAEADLRSAWRIFGGDEIFQDKVSSIYNGLGYSFLLIGEYEQAEHVLRLSIESIQRSIGLNSPSLPTTKRLLQNQIWLAMAEFHLKRESLGELLHEIEAKIGSLGEAHANDRDLDFFHCQVAWLRSSLEIDQDQIELALQTIQRELDRQAHIVDLHADHGYLNLYQGRLMSNLAFAYRSRGENKKSEEFIAGARGKWRLALEGTGRSSAAAAFDLMQSWCESPSLAEQDRMECIQLSQRIITNHANSPNAWFWHAEVTYRFQDQEEACHALRKLSSLRPHAIPQDKLLTALLARKFPCNAVKSDELKVLLELGNDAPICKGTHAWFLQRELNDLQ